MFNSIINRLDSLEKKEKDSSSNPQVSKLEAEIRDIKDLLMSQILKYEKFTLETNKRFDDVDEAFVELEKQQETLQSYNSSILLDTDVLNTDTSNDVTLISGSLKSAIEQELADSTKP